MKRIIAVILISLFLIVGCSCGFDEVERTPVDCRYTAAYSGVKTNYAHEYDWWRGDFVLVPKVETVNYPEKYEIQYVVTYEDGTTNKVWQTVSKEEYMTFKEGGK